MVKLIKMQRADGHTADVHPDEVDNYKEGDYRVVEAAPDPITPETIASMKRADVIDLLEAHGVEGATGPVGKLRDQLTAIMFVGG